MAKLCGSLEMFRQAARGHMAVQDPQDPRRWRGNEVYLSLDFGQGESGLCGV